MFAQPRLMRSVLTKGRRAPGKRPGHRPRVEGLEDRCLMASPDLSPIVRFKVVNDWGSGFQAEVDFVSSQNTKITDWSLEFDFPRAIDSIWNASVVSHVGSRYVIKNGGWNAILNAGQHGVFGFTGSTGNLAVAPTNPVLRWTEPAAARPSLSIDDVAIGESNSGTKTAMFTVSLSSASTSAVTVAYATVGDTATSGEDFVAASGTLTFAAGETTKTIAVQVRGDTLQEPDERYFVTLSNAQGATLGKSVGTGTILDDDAPPPTLFAYGEALQKSLFFYEAQRSGDLPGNFPVDWRGDSAMTDGKDVGRDLTGGYYDAGDHVKFGHPMGYSMAMLAWGVVQYRDAYARSGQLGGILDAIRWGTDYIVKAHTGPNEFWGQVGRGDLDHASWAAPELMTMARPAFKIDAQHPGTDLAAGSAAALAAAAIAFQPTDPAYAALLIKHAQELYTFADTYRGKYSDSIADAANYYGSYGYMDELVWGALWLSRATGSQAYLTKAQTLYDANFAGQTMTWTQSWDDVRYGSAVILAQMTGKTQYKTDVERYLDYWTVGLNGGSTRVRYTPGGLAFLDRWGSLRYSTTTAFLAFVYSDSVRDVAGRYHNFAVRQINYALGDNPQQRSYMVGFGANSPQNPHHRGASGVWDGNVANPAPNRHILYGALVGGPKSPSDADYRDLRDDYIANEVALDYNAGFTGALARMYLEYGGAPLANFPIPETRDHEFFVQADINNQGPTFTEIDAQLNNRSAWPARSSTSLSFRYFVNLSEVYAAGYSTNDVLVQMNYSQGATVSGLVPWDVATRAYYVEVSFAGVTIAPGAGTFMKEAQVRIGLKPGVPSAAWNPGNDWSYQGLVPGPNRNATTAYIPVYETGRGLLFGQTPAQTDPATPIMTIDDVSIAEGNSGTKLAILTVRLSKPSTSAVSVLYATADGTATAGQDYTPISGSLAFAAGETVKTFTVPILGDTLAEGNETVRVTLSSAKNAAIGRGLAMVTILDDDPPASGAASVAMKVKDDWGAGFVADVTIKNTGSDAIDGWVLEFDLAAEITSIWNGEIVKRVGNRYTVRSMSYNRIIAAGSSATFGFQAVPLGPSRTIANMVLNGKPV